MYREFLWNFDPGENVEHIAEHDLTPEDVENAFDETIKHTRSRSSGRKALFGFTPDGRVIFVVYEELDDTLMYVHTAYEKEND